MNRYAILEPGNSDDYEELAIEGGLPFRVGPLTDEDVKRYTVREIMAVAHTARMEASRLRKRLDRTEEEIDHVLNQVGPSTDEAGHLLEDPYNTIHSKSCDWQ